MKASAAWLVGRHGGDTSFSGYVEEDLDMDEEPQKECTSRLPIPSCGSRDAALTISMY